MPRFDGTGPQGMGPGTGRGMGPCMNMGLRRGMGLGAGFGRGRQWWSGYGQSMTNNDKKSALEEYRKDLEAELEEVNKSLQEK